jgi:voltage-gated potassium channel
MTFKENVFHIINEHEHSTRSSALFNWFIVTLITLNVIAIIAESFAGMREVIGRGFWYFEIFSVGVFTIEYLARLWTFDLKYPDEKPWRAFRKTLTSPLAILDLLAILPTYVPFLIPIDLRALRILRPMRVVQVFKLTRYFRALKLIGNVFKEKRWELEVTFFMAFILLLLSSTLMYYAEYAVQPQHFPNILASFWWAIITLTTVGYGDVVPITTFGKLLGGIISLLGVGLVALPTAILGSAFIQKNKQQRSLHHHCECCRCKKVSL